MNHASAGILLFRRSPDIELLLVHPGGPFWRNRDAGAWQIPKGLIDAGEDEGAAARRELREETGLDYGGKLLSLGTIRRKGGKQVIAFAAESDCDTEAFVSNMFEMEWPPRSGRRQSFPEVDEMRWFRVDAARAMILPSQAPLIERLLAFLMGRRPLTC